MILINKSAICLSR